MEQVAVADIHRNLRFVNKNIKTRRFFRFVLFIVAHYVIFAYRIINKLFIVSFVQHQFFMVAQTCSFKKKF